MSHPLTLNTLAHAWQTHRDEQRRLNQVSQTVLQRSKQAIFALHRNDLSQSAMYLAEVNEALKPFIPFDNASLRGALRPALEEYTEAWLLSRFFVNESVEPPVAIIDPEIVIGGYADYVGELVRVATNAVIHGKRETVERVAVEADRVISALVELDLTGVVRTKYDQAKQHMRRLETIRYDLALRSL